MAMAMAMATSVTALTSSLSSFSFSSQISHKPFQSLSFSSPKPLSLRSAAPKFPALVVAASSALADADVETADLKQLVKSRLPGGSGKIIINYRDAKDYLQGNPLWLQYVKTPLVTLGYESSYDVFVKAHGGGLSGQAQAISLGIARALLKVSDSHRSPLKQEGLLTRDARVVERKKPGLRKARKRPQYSKR
ncbi:UNVERIFIED_CONTAM: 30S ribosomal protein S9, chloroplastic [Sesamum angustifolium]|uniref:Small ribosomal subunit protein uS9c n=1 Tax=Sesamum angustifolium TaxID=2727405 RepID=A0AAW2L8G9_9LAMI